MKINSQFKPHTRMKWLKYLNYVTFSNFRAIYRNSQTDKISLEWGFGWNNL